MGTAKSKEGVQNTVSTSQEPMEVSGTPLTVSEKRSEMGRSAAGPFEQFDLEKSKQILVQGAVVGQEQGPAHAISQFG
jgi:hypothetical protein